MVPQRRVLADPVCGAHRRAAYFAAMRRHSFVLIDAPLEINKMWREAVDAAPKPDPAHLDQQWIVLPIDVDATLEVGREALMRNDKHVFGTLMPGELKQINP